MVEDRVENLAAAGQAREETIDAVVKNDGTILALDVKMRLNPGTYPLIGTPSPLFGWIVRTMIGSAYRIDNMRWPRSQRPAPGSARPSRSSIAAAGAGHGRRARCSTSPRGIFMR